MMLPTLLKPVQTKSLVVTHLKVAACLRFIMAILLFHVFLATSLTRHPNYLPSFVLLSEVNATIWQIDVNGDVISTDTYPLLFEPDEDDTLHYFTYAYDINNQGIAVGEGLTGDRITITRPNSSGRTESERVATVFRDGETIELLPREENIISQGYRN